MASFNSSKYYRKTDSGDIPRASQLCRSASMSNHLLIAIKVYLSLARAVANREYHSERKHNIQARHHVYFLCTTSMVICTSFQVDVNVNVNY